jgi:uncharacterized membrane protein YfcA
LRYSLIHTPHPGPLPQGEREKKVVNFKCGCPGALGGMSGFSGTIPTLWCTIRGFDKNIQRTIIQNFNLITLAITMIIYVSSGIVTTSMISIFVVIALAMAVPTMIGANLYIGISEPAFRKIVLSLLTVSGITLLLSSLTHH